jgi:hypothetical protein
MNLRAPSGRIFLGAAEEVTADGFEPEAIRGGMFLDVQPGGYWLCVSRDGTEISLSLQLTDSWKSNQFGTLIRI